MTNTTKKIEIKGTRKRVCFRVWLRTGRGRRNVFVKVCLVLLCLSISSRLVQGQSSDPNVQFTQGDVNESATLSLGVQFGKYKGRGLDLPISLSYSSSVWRIEQLNKISNSVLYPPFPVTQSVTQAIYAEHSVAGWKCTLDLPQIEFPKQTDTYDYKARAYPSSTWNGCFGYRIARLYVHMPDGSTHECRKNDAPYYSDFIDQFGTFYSVDGSRMRYDSTGVDTGTLYTADGTRYVLGHPTSSIIDANGNTQTFDETTREWTDTMGRVIRNPLPATAFDQRQDYDYNLPGLNGGSVVYSFKWRFLSESLTPDPDGSTPVLRYMASHYLPDPNSLPTNTGKSNAPSTQPDGYDSLFQTATPADPYDDPNAPSPVPVVVVGKGQSRGQLFDPIVLQEIDLPDGTNYQFSYNIYGEVNKVTYPSTSYEKYDYSSAPSDIDQDKQPYIQTQRRITSRQLSTNGLGTDLLEWKYLAIPPIGSVANPVNDSGYRVVSIIAPDKTRTEYYEFEPAAHDGTGRPYWAFDFADSTKGLIFQTISYSSSPDGLGGQMLRREITQYEQKVNSYPFSVTCGQTPFTRTITAYRNPRSIKKVSIIFEGDGPALAQTSTFSYDNSDEMRTGVDQVGATTSQFAVVDNSIARSGTLAQIPVGSLAKSSETIYANSPSEPNSAIYRNKNILGLPTISRVKDSAGVIVSQNEMRYDESPYSPELGRGLATSSRVWDSSKGLVTNPNAYLMTHAKFDLYGNRIEATDAVGNITLTEYDATYHALAVKVTSPAADPNPAQNPDGMAHGSQATTETSSTYDFSTGLVLSTTDVNGQITQLEYNDPFLRQTRLIPPDGGAQIVTEHGLGTTEATRYVRVKTQTDANNWKETTRFCDGGGRIIKTQLRDSNGDVFTETQYDNMGRVAQVSNPYRAGETKFWTSSTYDDLGRVIRVTSPDGSQLQTAYGFSTTGVIGATKTNIDQAGRKRSGITDGLGRMVRVIEDPDHQSLITDYVFDTLGNLRKTTQGEQVRYFMYDSLSQVLYSKQPEQEANASFNVTDPTTGNTQWSMKFTYDDRGNNVSTTDAKGASISGTFDHQNRLIFRDYSDATPDVGFYYDGTGLAQMPSYSKGKTTKVSNGVSETRFTTFDNLGRVKSSQQITNGVTYNFPDYSYDLAGNLISETYPSGRVVKSTLDANADLAKVASQKDGNSPLATYLDQIKYTTSGAVKESRLGNGLWETTDFNNRLQITQVGLGTSSSDTSLLKIGYDYGGANQNNGALREQKIYAGLGQPIVQSYVYDDINRLQSSTETYDGGAQSWKQTFTYDIYGNRRFDAANTNTFGSTPPTVANPLINTSDNRFSGGQGYVYDKVGNLTQDAENRRFAYDRESRQTQFFNQTNSSTAPDATYSYNGDGQRVRKTSGQFETVFVYDASGQLIAEYSTEPLVNPKTLYLTADHLGSPRIVTDQSGQVVSRHDYMAFGEEVSNTYANRSTIPGYGVTDGIREQFTGHERDTESGLDYAQARYYNSRHGRFTSVDPLTASATIRNPQTFNRYSYALNSPYKFTDPLGLMSFIPTPGPDGEPHWITLGDDGIEEELIWRYRRYTPCLVAEGPNVKPPRPSRKKKSKKKPNAPETPSTPALDKEVEAYNNAVDKADQKIKDDLTKAQLDFKNTRSNAPGLGKVLFKAGVGAAAGGGVAGLLKFTPAAPFVAAFFGSVAALDEAETQKTAALATLGTLITAVEKAEIDYNTNLPTLPTDLAIQDAQRVGNGEKSRLKQSTTNLVPLNDWIDKWKAFGKEHSGWLP